MIKIYGSPKSSSGRCFWALEEVAVDYTEVPIDFKKEEHKAKEFLEINPNGKIPCLVDDGFSIWESMAINFYLAEKYKPEILGDSIEEKSLVYQWSFWGISELQPPLIEIFIQTLFIPEEHRSQAVIDKAKKKLPKLFELLNESLAKEYLVGSNFTLADLNVVSVIDVAERLKEDLSNYKNITKWLNLIKARDSFIKYKALLN